MSESHQANPAAETPDYDPEVLELLEFDPVPRKVKLEGGWTPEKQRMFPVRLAVHGSPVKAANEIGMEVSGARKLYYSLHGESFRAAWDGIVELAKKRLAADLKYANVGSAPPSIDNRRRHGGAQPGQPQPGQVLNEFGEWEHPDSIARRAEDAKDSISNKLRNARRLFLAEISDSPGKRAAFEILTEYEVDWEKAARLEMQVDEPWRRPNIRQPDMLLSFENGWHGGAAWGEDKMQALRNALDEHREQHGLEPVDWESEDARAGGAE